MNKRMLLALALSAAVIGLTQYLFPPPKSPPKPAVAARCAVRAPVRSAAVMPPGGRDCANRQRRAGCRGEGTPVAADTAALTSARSTIRISSVGAVTGLGAPQWLQALTKGAKPSDGGRTGATGESLLQYALIVKEPAGNKVIDLAGVPFTATQADDRTVTYTGQSGAANVRDHVCLPAGQFSGARRR